jgi:uncharacterized protein (TIGR02246 family)
MLIIAEGALILRQSAQRRIEISALNQGTGKNKLNAQDTPTLTDSTAVTTLHRDLLEHWNQQRGDQYAALFTDNANLIGFDGSPVDGRAAIAAHIGGIFRDHQTARYVYKVREVRFLAPDVALLRAVVGMIPPGGNDIMPPANAVQSMVAVKQDGDWKIALFQNTPAQFHGRPEDAAALTEELRALV